MESLALFFFTLRLSLALLSEFFFVAVRLLMGTKTFFLSFFLSLVVASSWTVQLVFPTPPPQPQVVILKDRQAVETRIAFWESLSAVSPTRDIFLNLEKLYRYIDENDRALLYRKRAFELDPNNPEFVNDEWLWEEEETASQAASPSATVGSESL